MNMKQLIKSFAFRPGLRPRKICGGALRGMSFLFDLRKDTQQWRGIYEVPLQNWLVGCVNPGAVCVDIGAADGYFALLMARLAGPTGRVHAFEPSEDGRRIAQNIALNSDQPLAEVVVYDKFVGASDADARTVCVDSLIAAGGISRADVVKVDVEGAEADVLKGMEQTLTRFHPHLFVEAHSRALQEHVRSIAERHGYRMSLIAPPPYERRPLDHNVFLASSPRVQ